jgi:signal transduction histidine kinase
MQLTLAKVGGLVEPVAPQEILEDALLINSDDLARNRVEVKRHYDPAAGKITADKHKLLQILVNLIGNARNACIESNQSHKEIKLRLERTDGTIRMSVEDNGVGIASENLVRIFSHGFTTRKAGHGFGLHSGALAAKQMGGQLKVESDGLGHGARFILDLPTSDESEPDTLLTTSQYP